MNYEILFASNNKHKLQEVRQILSPYGITVYGLNDIILDADEPIEDGKTYRENALIKAEYYKKFTSLPIIADDSGLEVLSLDNIPGLNSARFAKEHNGHNNAMKYIINELSNSKDRTARFICEIVAINIENRPLFFSGIVDGKITKEILGESGFGYDPIFFCLEANKTYAELNEDEKNIYSHRAKALKKFITYLQIKGLARLKKADHHHEH